MLKNTGIGIAKEYREQVFKPFVRLHTRDEYSGSGLGLATVKKTIEQLNGTVHIEDPKHLTGTRFVIELPMAHTALQAEANFYTLRDN